MTKSWVSGKWQCSASGLGTAPSPSARTLQTICLSWPAAGDWGIMQSRSGSNPSRAGFAQMLCSPEPCTEMGCPPPSFDQSSTYTPVGGQGAWVLGSDSLHLQQSKASSC